VSQNNPQISEIVTNAIGGLIFNLKT